MQELDKILNEEEKEFTNSLTEIMGNGAESRVQAPATIDQEEGMEIESDADFVQRDLIRKSEERGKVVSSDQVIRGRNDDMSILMQGTKDPGYDQYQLDRSEMYTIVGDRRVGRYDKYMPGVDNEEIHALQQSRGEKFKRGAAKFTYGVGGVILGSTVGTVTGLFNAIKEGDINAISSDSFNTWLQEIDEVRNERLAHYYTKKESEMGILEALGSMDANFFYNDLSQGAVFLIGNIASEGIWAGVTGGGSLALAPARWAFRGSKFMNQLKKISSYKKMSNQMARFTDWGKARNATIVWGRTGQLANATRYMYTSAGYESAIEASQMAREARNEFWDYHSANGIEPSTEDIRAFNEALDSAQRATYWGNLALVGSTNLALYGGIFNISNPLGTVSKGARNRVFGMGIKGKGADRALREGTKLQKAGGWTYRAILRPGFHEGVKEEGLQSTMGNAASAWVKQTYDEDATTDIVGYWDALMEGASETYGGKQGWKEIGIGVIIGIMGGAFSGNIRGYRGERSQYSQYFESMQNGYTPEAFMGRMGTAVRTAKAADKYKASEEAGDRQGMHEAERDIMLNHVAFHEDMGMGDEASKDLAHALNLMDSAEGAEQMGITEAEFDAKKQEYLERYNRLRAEYAKDKEFANIMVGRGQMPKGMDDASSREMLAQAIAFNISRGKDSWITLRNATDNLKSLSLEVLGVDIADHLNMDAALTFANERDTQRHLKLVSDREKANRDLERINEEIAALELELANTSEETRSKVAEKLVRKQGELAALNRAIEGINTKLEASESNILSQATPYSNGERTITGLRSEVISQATLNDGTKVITALEPIMKLMESVKNSSPETYEILKQRVEDYKNAATAHAYLNETMKGLASPEFDLPTFATKMGFAMFGGKSVNDFTKEFVRRMLESPTISRATRIGEIDSRSNVTEDDGTPEPTPLTPEQESKLKELRKRIQEEMDQNPERVNELQEELNEGIRDIMEGNDELTESQKILKQINDIIEDDEGLGVVVRGDQIIEISNEDYQGNIDRYNEFLDKGQERTEDENREMDELRDKLDQTLVVDNFVIGDTTLGDLVERYKQLQQTPQESSTDLDTSDAAEIAKFSDKNASESRSNREMVQNPDGIYVRNEGDTITMSHLKLSGFVAEMGEGVQSVMYTTPDGQITLDVSQDIVEGTLGSYENMEGGRYDIVTEDGTHSITIGKHSRLEMTLETWDAISEDFGIKFMESDMDPQRRVGTRGYRVSEDGTVKSAETDFASESDSDTAPRQATQEEAANTKEVSFHVDTGNHYNKQLLAEYNASKKTKADKQKLIDNVVVYEVSGDKHIGNLRAATGEKVASDSSSNFIQLRRLAAEALINGQENTTTDLGVTAKPSVIFSGTPIFNLELNSEGEIVLSNKTLSEDGAERVIDFGYVQNGEVTLKGGTELGEQSTAYVPKDATRRPVIVFEYGGKKIVIPIGIPKISGEVHARVTEILESNDRLGRKVNSINQVLLEYGIAPSEYHLNEGKLSDTNYVDNFLAGLESIESYTNLDTWMEDNTTESLAGNVSVPVDITNVPFAYPKIRMDLANMEGLDTAEIVKAEPVIKPKPQQTIDFDNAPTTPTPIEPVPTKPGPRDDSGDGVIVTPTSDNAPRVQTVNVSDIKQDPKRFQYKDNTDEKGVTKKLKNARWEQGLANVISVWVDPSDGNTYVVNGHHRLELANRSNAETIDVRYIEADNASEARKMGALQNIAEGHGTDMDAAKILRESNIDENALREYGLSVTLNIASRGIALSKLSDSVFDAVVRKTIPVNVGVIIGENIESQDLQEQFYNKIKGRNYTQDTLRVMAQDMSNAPVEVVTTMNLFGEDTAEVAKYEERASFIGAVRGIISRTKNILGRTARSAEFLEQYGNKIDQEVSEGASREAAEALAVFDMLRNTERTITELINQGTERIENGENKSRVQRDISKQIIEATEAILRPKHEDSPTSTTISEVATVEEANSNYKITATKTNEFSDPDVTIERVLKSGKTVEVKKGGRRYNEILSKHSSTIGGMFASEPVSNIPKNEVDNEKGKKC